ncbi:MAG: DUF4058 family protein [Armatimonadetes bacterium]|nr:DUF4058 family protein [Armatimonadota bacterium]
MPSPFPGMDPYLEGHLWPDFHHRMASEVARRLTAQLRPRYVARLELYIVEDPSPEAEIGIMYPDVEVFSTSRRADLPTPERSMILAPLTLPLLKPVPVRVSSVEIRDTAGNILVASIEMISPVNKREPNLTRYREKRLRLHRSGVHLLELDLLRRGTRPMSHPRMPEAAYFVTLTRGGAASVEVWPLRMTDPLPTVPVPLRDPDPDEPLELGTCVSTVYEDAAYELSLDYSREPPPPPLKEDEQQCLREVRRVLLLD